MVTSEVGAAWPLRTHPRGLGVHARVHAASALLVYVVCGTAVSLVVSLLYATSYMQHIYKSYNMQCRCILLLGVFFITSKSAEK